MDLAPVRIRFHEAAQPCTSLVTSHDIKTDKYKCAKGHEWQPSDVSKTLCVHVLDDNNRVVSLPQITRYVIDDGDDDEEEEDEDDEDEEGDEDEDESRSRKEDGKRGKSDQKKAPKRVDGDAPNDDDDDDDDGNNDEQPQYLFVAFCPKRHASPLMHLKDAFVRIDRPHCQSIKEVVAKLVKRIREQKDDLAFNLTTDRMRFHRMDDRDCKGDLGFKTLLSDHTVPTTTPDEILWGKKVVRLHVERQGESSAESNKAAKPTSSIGKPGSSRAPSNPLGGGDGSSSGRGARREDGNHSAAGGNDSGGGGQGSNSEERSRYLVFVSCPEVHSWLSLQLKKTWVKVDPPFVDWAQNGVLRELRRRVGGSDLPTLPTGDRAVSSIHPLGRCENQLTLQQALRDYGVQSAGAGVPFDQSKRLFVHFAKPPAGQPPTQGSSTVITSASQSGQNPKKRSSPVSQNGKGVGGPSTSAPAAKRPRTSGNEDEKGENNTTRRTPGTDKAKTDDAKKARWLLIQICGLQHPQAPPSIKNEYFGIRIDTPDCKTLQDIGSKFAASIRNRIGTFGYDRVAHNARFHRRDDEDCEDRLNFNRLLKGYKFLSPPTDEEVQRDVATQKLLVQLHFDGNPKLFNKQDQTKNAQLKSNGKAEKRKVDNEDDDETDDPFGKEGPRKRQSNSTSGRPATRTKAADNSRHTATDGSGNDSGQVAQPGAVKRKRQASGNAASAKSPKKRRRKSLITKPRKTHDVPVLDPVEQDGGESEEERNGDAADESDDENQSEDADEQDDGDDAELCDWEVEELDGTRHIRVGQLKTEGKFRRPADGQAFGLRRIVVALVENKRGRWTVEFVAVDSWVINGSRVGDYPSADPWERDKGAKFTPDPYWRRAHSANALRQEVLDYYKEHKNDTFIRDNDSVLSDYARTSHSTTTPPEAPKKPITAPLYPQHTSTKVTRDFGPSAGPVTLRPKERIHAVVCFANALGESSRTSSDSSLHTYRNFQISMPRTQNLTEFRAFIQNVKMHDSKGNLKQILRNREYGWWGDFQVWIMPLHSATVGQVGDARAYCWDDVNHNRLTISNFLHRTDYTRVKRAELFIEIRIVPDPKYRRKERAWVSHDGYREGRTRWFGWKQKSKNNGRCILDDEEDKGQIQKDTNAKTLPPQDLFQ